MGLLLWISLGDIKMFTILVGGGPRLVAVFGLISFFDEGEP